MGQITYRGRVFSNDDTSHLFVTNNKGQKIKLEMQIYKYLMWNPVNVGNLWVSNDPRGVGIEGRDSKRRSVINDKFVSDIISFVDNPSKTDIELSGDNTISLKKKGINESNLKKMLRRSINEMKNNMRKRPGNPYNFKYEKNDEDLSLEDPFIYSVDPSYDSPVDDEGEHGMDYQDQEDTPEGLSIEDEDESFQRKMRLQGFKKYKPAVSGEYRIDWNKLKKQKPYSPIKRSDVSLDKYLDAKNKGINLDESNIKKIIRQVLKEEENQRYMFFSNLEQIKRQCDLLLEMDENMISQVLENGHDWAQDHIATAKESIDQVFDFLMNESKTDFDLQSDNSDLVSEGRKKTGTKLCARGKSAAKAKFKVYPSAYANGYAVQVCKGKMPGSDGKKRCSPPYC